MWKNAMSAMPTQRQEGEKHQRRKRGEPVWEPMVDKHQREVPERPEDTQHSCGGDRCISALQTR